MSLGRGKQIGSLLQRGYGLRSGVGSAFAGNGNPFLGLGSSDDETSFSTSPVTVFSGVSGSRRYLATRARKIVRLGRRKKASGPTMDIAKAMPLTFQEMANSELITLGAMGNTDACKEILKRHIMSVDRCSYEAACEQFQIIAEKNREGMFLVSLPYKVGIAMALGAAFGSFPMVFDLNTAQWFNEFYVTTDVPEPRDLETPLEVGSWTWNWMEPPLGQISFFLLCLQYSRNQIQNIGMKPYTAWSTKRRAQKLADAFPQYDAKVLMNFSESVTIYGKHGIGDSE